MQKNSRCIVVYKNIPWWNPTNEAHTPSVSLSSHSSAPQYLVIIPRTFYQSVFNNNPASLVVWRFEAVRCVRFEATKSCEQDIPCLSGFHEKSCISESAFWEGLKLNLKSEFRLFEQTRDFDKTLNYSRKPEAAVILPELQIQVKLRVC